MNTWKKYTQPAPALSPHPTAKASVYPLIEAAQHKLPIIARDIPVFREVAGEYAYYFDGKEPSDLAQSITKWLQLHASEQHPTSDNMPWLTWKESAAHLMQNVLKSDTQNCIINCVNDAQDKLDSRGNSN